MAVREITTSTPLANKAPLLLVRDVSGRAGGQGRETSAGMEATNRIERRFSQMQLLPRARGDAGCLRGRSHQGGATLFYDNFTLSLRGHYDSPWVGSYTVLRVLQAKTRTVTGLAIELSRAPSPAPLTMRTGPHDVCERTRNVGLEQSGVSPHLPQPFPPTGRAVRRLVSHPSPVPVNSGRRRRVPSPRIGTERRTARK